MRRGNKNIESEFQSDDDGLSTYDVTLIASRMYTGLYNESEKDYYKDNDSTDEELMAA